MNNRVNRRDFLKYAGAIPLGYAASKFLPLLEGPHQDGPRNVIIVVFDALSAHDVSTYGYPRETAPNITRLAKRAIRYHNHFAAGNFTTPGTASLLTGVLPWTHRAINLNGRVARQFRDRNMFSAFKDYHGIAYSHNGYANIFLKQFAANIDLLIPRESLYIDNYDAWITALFGNDEDIATISWFRNMNVNEEGSAYSLFLSHLYESLQDGKIKSLKSRFPRGIPSTGPTNPFLLETAIDAIGQRLNAIPRPFLGYFHFMPPHHPYNTTIEFVDAFKGDGYQLLEKPIDVLATRRIIPQRELSTMRREYDEFILYCDREFGRLYAQLEESGQLRNTWLVLTSDHGEMFERGNFGHNLKVLYQPVIRIPLLIFEPGRTEGTDVFDYTSAIDVLPTLAHLTGQESPTWTEGTILPPFATHPAGRDILAMQASENEPASAWERASITLVRENYKLHYYYGYEETSGNEIVRLFDIQSDPEEMTDLASTQPGIASELLNDLKAKLAEANEPYR